MLPAAGERFFAVRDEARHLIQGVGHRRREEAWRQGA